MAPRLPIDLESNKELFKSFIASETDFTDYNFEGSNLSQLNDMLAFNTQQIAFYLNMVVSELFIDSAKIDQNILKIANTLNYLPRRNVAPYVTVEFTRVGTDTVSIAKYTNFKLGSIPITNLTDIVLDTDDPVSIKLYEGEIVSEVFTPVGSGFEEFYLSNREEIDDSYFKVYVDVLQSDGSYEITEFYNANASDFVESRHNYYFQYLDRVSVRFDDGSLFVAPSLGDNVRIVYLKTNGELYNNESGTISYNGDNSQIEYSFIINSSTHILKNGLNKETNPAIALRAPLFFTTQGRAVTESDYNIIIARYSRFDTFAGGIAWNGADEFIYTDGKLSLTSNLRDVGHVELTFLNSDFSLISDLEKEEITTFLNKVKPMMIFPRFINPTILYVNISTEIDLISEINTDISELESTIYEYLESLQGFKKEYKRSNVIQFIDAQSEVNYIILSTDFNFRIYYNGTGFFRCFNEITPGSVSFVNSEFEFGDDGSGNLQYKLTGGSFSNVGTIDYENGLINITSDLPDAYGFITFALELENINKINTQKECFLTVPFANNTILR